jgi:DNA-binding winged helix-turn-helix (wHTH) protein
MGAIDRGVLGGSWRIPWVFLVSARPGPKKVAIHFGGFTLDEERRELLADTRPVHLSRKAYELLSLLAKERPRAIGKAELHQRLWPDTFVSDATLASLVADVRAALGESARETRFIRTVHGFGYGFAALATETGEQPDAVSPALACWIVWNDRPHLLQEGENVLGRLADAAVCIDALSVSRHHARVIVTGAAAMLEDLGSKNGTQVDGVPVTTPVPLKDGAVIHLGSVVVTFRTLAAPGSTVTGLSEQLR